MQCEAEAIFDSVHDILKRGWERTPTHYSDEEIKNLIVAVKRWHTIECPNNGRNCVPGRCRFADPLDWLEYNGYKNLLELMNDLEIVDGGLRLKERSKIDPLDAPWARRPGHYNP